MLQWSRYDLMGNVVMSSLGFNDLNSSRIDIRLSPEETDYRCHDKTY
jgi:hypothetical protein